LHSALSSAQIWRRESPFPFLVRKISPETIFCFLGVLLQLPAQLAGQEDRADFPFQGDVRTSGPRRLDCDVFYLADTDACSADYLHERGQAGLAQTDRRVEELFVLRF